ncbi:MAG: cupredoxin domain-containing protein [Actinomycetota bacterium]
MLTLAAGLTTGHKIGLAVVGACFIAFALSVSFLAPRRWPDFPGKNGMSVFIIASLVFFGAMLTSVLVFGKEHEAKAAEKPGSLGQGSTSHTIKVTESEWKVQLPATSETSGGTFTFVVHNAGKIPHDLAVTGPGISGTEKTPTIKPGGDATLKVALSTGSYTLYCTVPGHRQLGMVAKLSVG